jgi:hypothetical protein
VTIAADGTVSIQKVDVQTYTLTEANATFEGYLRNDILRAFNVEMNSSANPNAALYVTMVNAKKDAFVAELKKQILEASMDNSGNSSVDPTSLNIKNLEAYLLEWANSNLLEELKKNGIADALEADALDNLEHTDFTKNAEDGAKAMHDGLDAMDPARLSVVASQIPNSKWMSAFNNMGDSGMPGSRSASLVNRLPLEDGGDSMTFQFVITQNFVVSESNPVSGASMMPDSVVNTGIGSSAGGIGPAANETLLGHYSVPTRIINLVLTRPHPSSYPALKGASYPVPLASESGVAWNVNDCIAAVGDSTSGAVKEYNDAVGAANTAYGAWKTADENHIARVLADKKVSDATAFEAAARSAQTTALAQAGSDTTGPLYNAAQRAIEAAAIALADLSGCVAAQGIAVAADLDPVNSEAEIKLGVKLTDSKTATELVTTKFKALATAQDALAAARVALARQTEWVAHQQAIKDAAQESANTAAKVALDQWSDASANAIDQLKALGEVRDDTRAADRAYYDADIELNAPSSGAAAAYAASKSEANATRLKIAQDLFNETKAAYEYKLDQFNAQRGSALKAITAAHDSLVIYVEAAELSDSSADVAAPFQANNDFVASMAPAYTRVSLAQMTAVDSWKSLKATVVSENAALSTLEAAYNAAWALYQPARDAYAADPTNSAKNDAAYNQIAPTVTARDAYTSKRGDVITAIGIANSALSALTPDVYSATFVAANTLVAPVVNPNVSANMTTTGQ